MKHVLSFYGTVGIGAVNTFVSQGLRFPYVIERIRVKFALGHIGLVQHRFFVSPDSDVVVAGVPNGLNILAQYGNVDYVLGDDDVMEMYDQTVVNEAGTWLKVCVYNADAVAHTINVLITIDDLRTHPTMERLVAYLKAQGLTLIPNPDGVIV